MNKFEWHNAIFPWPFQSLAMWISEDVGPAAPHCSVDHFAAGFVMSEYHKASCHCFATGDIELHFLSTVSPSKMGNQTIVFCRVPTPEFPWSLPWSLFQSCQQVSESIINLWGPCLLSQLWVIPQDTGVRTRKPQRLHNPEGMDGIISLSYVRVYKIFQKRTSCIFLQASPTCDKRISVLSEYADTEEGPWWHMKRKYYNSFCKDWYHIQWT